MGWKVLAVERCERRHCPGAVSFVNAVDARQGPTDVGVATGDELMRMKMLCPSSFPGKANDLARGEIDTRRIDPLRKGAMPRTRNIPVIPCLCTSLYVSVQSLSLRHSNSTSYKKKAWSQRRIGLVPANIDSLVTRLFESSKTALAAPYIPCRDEFQ